MKEIMQHLSPVAFGLLTLAPLFAHADTEMRVSKVESQLRESSTSNARGTYGAKLADASPNIDGYGFYISADVILYKLYEDNNGYASVQTGDGLEGVVQPSGYINQAASNFNWSWGFKTALGYYAEHDFWQTGFEFSYLQAQTSASATATSSQYLIQAFNTFENFYLEYTNPVNFTSASDSWKVTFYNLDWTLGKDFFVSKYLSFLPEIGVKTAWFYQNRTLSYGLAAGTLENDVALTKTTRFQDQYVGVGPKADLQAKFYLGKNFSVIGGIDVALLYATNKTSYTATAFPVDATDTSFNYNYSSSKTKYHVSPFAGINLGLAYDTNFNEDSFNFGIKLAYELQYYNKASRMIAEDQPSASDISMQGVDLSFIFSF